jgi:cell wall-associated NlpC family hydrolase
VERPAAQYRGRYQLQLDDARSLLRRAFPDGDGVEDVAQGSGGSEPHAGSKAREAVAEARKYLGTPYQWGGESPQTGFDCSGLVQWAYAKAGIQIPRVTDQQIDAPGGIKVGRKHLLPGDLVFFRDASGYVHHVGMSLGGDRFIEAPRTGLNVRISSLNDPYYAQQFTGGRRFDAPAPGHTDARVMPALKLPVDDD